VTGRAAEAAAGLVAVDHVEVFLRSWSDGMVPGLHVVALYQAVAGVPLVESSCAIGLPDAARVRVQRVSQPPRAVGVKADQEAQISTSPLNWGVCPTTATLPEQCGAAVLASVTRQRRACPGCSFRATRAQAGVNEQVAARLMVGPAAGQELAVLLGNPVRQGATGTARNPAVRAEGVGAAQRAPPPQGRDVAECIEQQLFMVPQQRDQAAMASEGDESIQNATAVWASVDVVAQGDQRIFGAGLDGSEQGSQGGQAAVDVADGYRAARHATSNRLASQNDPVQQRQPVAGDGEPRETGIAAAVC
jgi:hypothetical protein